jgi:translocation and assembly module TamB
MVDTSDFFSKSDNKEQNNNSLKKMNYRNFWRSLIYLMLLSLGGGISYSWYFLTQKMIPMIEKPVSRYLSRPVKLGEIKAVSFTSIRLGESYLPNTELENDHVIAKNVEIKVNPLKLLQKQVKLDINIDQAIGYLQQDENNQWLKLKLNKKKYQPGQWRFTVDKITINNGKLNVKNNRYPENQNTPVVKATIPNAKIVFDNPQQYSVNFTGNLSNGGEIKGSGFYKPQEKKWLLQLDNQHLPIDTVTHIVNLPVNIDSGKINGQLGLNFLHSKLDLNSLHGEMNFSGVNLSISKLPQTLTNSDGQIGFKDKNIILKEVNTKFGDINAQAEGIIRNYRELDIQANTSKSISIDNLFKSLKIKTGNLEKQGKIKGKLNITGNIQKPLVKAEIVNDREVKIEKISINQLSTQLAIHNSQINLEKFEALPSMGGKIDATGKINLNRQDSTFKINWQAQQLPAEKLATLYQQELPIEVGMLDGNFNLIGNWQQLEQTKLTGSSHLDLANGEAKIQQLEIDQNHWQGNVNLSSFKLSEIPELDCNKIGCQESILNGNFLVSGKTTDFNKENINLTGRFDFNLAQGKVILDNTLINGDNWQTEVKLDNLEVSKIPAVDLSSSPIQTDIKLTANLNAQGKLSDGEEIQIQGQGSINLPHNKIKISQFTLKENEFSTTTIANAFPLKQLNQNLRGNATGKLTFAGNINYLQPKFIHLDGNLNLSEGISLIKHPIDVAFQWDGDKIQLKKAVIDKAITAKGIINYDLDKNDVTDVNLNINAQQLELQKLPLPQSLALLNSQGKIDFQGKLDGEIVSPQLSGEVTVNDLQLANLPFSQLKGNLTASKNQGMNLSLNASANQDKLLLQFDSNYKPQNIDIQTQNTVIQGKTEEENLAIKVQNIPLDQVIQPWLTYFPESVKQVDGNLSGDVNLALDNYQLQKASFVINKPKINHLQGDILATELTYNAGKFTLNKGNLTHQKNQYHFTGELQPFTDNPQLRANVEIKEGDIQNLLASLQFFEFSDIPKGFQAKEYSKAKDLYSSVNGLPTETKINYQKPTVEDDESSTTFLTRSQKGEVAISKKLLNVNKKQELNNQSPLASSFKISSQSTETNKPLASINTKNQSLLDTLTFFEDIEQQVNQQKNIRTSATVPKLEELDGDFAGNMEIVASLNEGIKAEFDFQGNSWQWGKYGGNLFQITGSYNNGLLTFLPIRIQDNDSFLSLTGTFQPERISGQVTLSKLPLNHLKTFLNLPSSFDIDGNINATIAISGSQEKPLAKGNIEVVDSTINGNNIEKTQASFGLSNSRINLLANSILNEEQEYFTIIASVPFRLFSNSLEPENNEFKIDFNVSKEGFSLLNVVTDNQLNWVKGDGNIDLEIQGKYDQARNEVTDIQTKGIANLTNAVITGKILNQQEITNINGQILFDFAQLNIPNLTGDFSGGKIFASGNLPIIIEPTIENQSLKILVDDLALNLENLYEGDLQANLDISGSALSPDIGGKVKLENGNIKISKNKNNQNQESTKVSQKEALNKIKFNDLTVTLGENLHIIQPLLLKLRADGNLTINGDLNNLSPEGVVKLKSGTVNLFTSQLKLVENHDNIARFTPANGFNPYLDVQLESSVTETSRYQLPDNSHPNEIQDISNLPLNTAQTIKVKANVQGWADDLNAENIELTSSPARGQVEIIALLGGGFANNFTAGNSELNLVNFASAAVLGTVQGQIQKALGFDELRFFPVQILDPEERTSTFGIGAELGLDLTDNFSFSVMKILTNEQAPQYNVRYRLNEQFILRGSTDFESDSRSAIEFQQRF